MSGVQGLGQTRLRTAGAEGFLLALVWRPAGEKDHLEGRADAAVRVREPVLIDRTGAANRLRRAGFRCRSISALDSPIARRSCISAKMSA
jgi:hypothetical protein